MQFATCFGLPEVLHTDNGKEFEGLLTALCDYFGVQRMHGRPYYPQVSGWIVRRALVHFGDAVHVGSRWCRARQSNGSREAGEGVDAREGGHVSLASVYGAFGLL